jgi:transcriptional regulator with XRE-family HTH domain
MCEQEGMKPTTSELAAQAGISKSYASEIVNGMRNPSRPLAIHIFRKTKWKHEIIADLTDEQLAMLESIEPWQTAA